LGAPLVELDEARRLDRPSGEIERTGERIEDLERDGRVELRPVGFEDEETAVLERTQAVEPDSQDLAGTTAYLRGADSQSMRRRPAESVPQAILQTPNSEDRLAPRTACPNQSRPHRIVSHG